MARSGFKMKGSPFQDKPEDKFKTYQSTLDSVTADMTDDQLRQMVLKQHGGKASKWNISYNTLKKQRSSMKPKTTEKPTEKKTTEKQTSITPGELRKNIYNEESFADKPGWFEGTKPLSGKRKQQLSKDSESGYTEKLLSGMEKKYGTKSYSEIDNPGDYQMARDMMVDPQTGEVLPMSSTTGQHADNPWENPLQKKGKVKGRSFKMKGWSGYQDKK